MNDSDLLERAADVLRANDRGGYSVPTEGLYPFQWNWDSGFTALGWAHLDETRAWQEIEHLFVGQWEDGFLPHIVFHRPSAEYFPGPEEWGVERQPPTSGITQPPVVATVVRKLLDGARDKALAGEKARALYPRLLAHHQWWARARDPEDTGLVAILHPWESGMDNSPAWDEALARVPVPPGLTYTRRDTRHVDSAQRPRREEYDRFIALVRLFRELRYDPDVLHGRSPFCIVDVGINAILHRADRDLAVMAEMFGTAAERAWIARRLQRTDAAFATLWSAERRLYQPFDRVARQRIDVATSAGFLPLYAGLPDAAMARQMAGELTAWGRRVAYLVPSNAPDAATFEPRRYWRGPVWAIVNWMIAEGLAGYGQRPLAERVRADTRRLIERTGFSEYFDPLSGDGLGGGRFTWTAAVAIAWLSENGPVLPPK